MGVNKVEDVGRRRKLPLKCTFTGNLEKYKITDTLQDSLYGRVYQGYGVDSGKLVAIKVLSKNDIITKEMNRSLPETPLAEVFFADEMADHEYLATIRDVFETEDSHCIVSDLADGEDLLELLRKNRYGLEESQARICIKQAAIALSKCHERGFALQDFSLENCLLYSVCGGGSLGFNNENLSENVEVEGGDEACRRESARVDDRFGRRFQVKVCDPGQAIRFGRYSPELEMPVPYLGCVGKKFRPPEIFSGRPYIASKVDSWCLGWSTFYLLFGTELFESVHNVDNDVRWQWYSMGYRDYLYSYLGVKERISLDARSFIEALVHPDPLQRMSVREALSHPFLRDVNEHENLVLEGWGRPVPDLGLGDLAKSFKAERVPFIPEVYKTKYLRLYCTGDKPSGYLPVDRRRAPQAQKTAVMASSNHPMPITARCHGGNVAPVPSKPGVVGSGGVFQKRRGVVNSKTTSISSNASQVQSRVSVNQNQAGSEVLEAGNGLNAYSQQMRYQQCGFHHYYGYGYNMYYGSGTAQMGGYNAPPYYYMRQSAAGSAVGLEQAQKCSHPEAVSSGGVGDDASKVVTAKEAEKPSSGVAAKDASKTNNPPHQSSSGGVEMRHSAMMYQSYGFPVAGRGAVYSSSYVPVPNMGFGAGSAGSLKVPYNGLKPVGAGIVNSNGGTPGGQGLKNCSYVPPPLTSRDVGMVGHQIKGGGVKAGVNYGSMSYVPPTLRR
ncbi:protein kinase [Cryptosporidium canis]|uniref:Protein kinase n=2 Tax=Cryptosporidium canis TaxID=195482 RepID=A0A9D5DGD0_9CRYT|nr:protein kinase [Cryptosporidium canis]